MKKKKIVASLLSAVFLMTTSTIILAAEAKSAYTIEVNGKTVKENILVVEDGDAIK